MKKYALLRVEVMFHLASAKSHTKYFQAFFVGFLFIAWYLFFAADPKTLSHMLEVVSLTKVDMLVYLLIAMNITSYYFAIDILDSYFCIFLAGTRLANIEDQVNRRAGTPLLIWELRFQLNDFVRFGVSRVAITYYQMLIIFMASFLFPLFDYCRLWSLTDSVHRTELGIASLIAVLLLLLFIYTWHDVFITKRRQLIEILQQVAEPGYLK